MSSNLLHANDVLGQWPGSYYAATRHHIDPFPRLEGDTEADVCVVGAGYTGLSAALHLAQKGLKVVVLEAHRVGFGASGRNGGQVGSGQRQDQDWLEKEMGREDARRMWDLAQEAKALVRELITDNAMDVPMRDGVAHACRSHKNLQHAHAYAEKLARDYGYHQIETLDYSAIRSLIGSDAYRGGDLDRGAFHIHPLNFCIGLARAAASAGVRIFEKSEATAIGHGPKVVVATAQGRVRCDHLVLAANGYLGNLEPKVASRVMPINNFIVATEPLGARAREVLAEPVAVADDRFVVNYWRLSDDDRLLFGGGESYGWKFPDIVRTVTRPMFEVYPQLKGVRIDHAWGGTLAITMNRMPFFGRPHPRVFSASGYSGHGVAMSTLAGKLIAEAVAGQAGRFDLMASVPTPGFPGGPMARWPLLVLAMTWYGMRDRLGI